MRIFLLLLFVLPSLLNAQSLKVIPAEEIILTADRFVGVDKFKDLYYTTQQVLHKKTPGKEYQFSDIQLGKISSVDLINPLRITLFYDQFNTAVILDNTLNEITRINFNQIESFRNVSHARTASDRKLWIYNVDRQRLELYNYQRNEIVTESPPIAHIAKELTANFNSCWVYAGNHLKMYNIYGSLVSDISISDLESLNQNDNILYGLKNGKVVVLPRGNQDFVTVGIEENEIKDLYYANEILYIYTGKVLKTYTLNLPKK